MFNKAQFLRNIGKYLLILPALTVTGLLFASKPVPVKEAKDTLYKKRFPGGAAAFTNFMSKNIHYPRIPHTAGITGKVTAQFQLSPDGTIKNIKLIDTAQEDLGKEVERLLNMLPKFDAARSRKTKTVLFTVLFLLIDEHGKQIGPDPDKVKADITVIGYPVRH